MIAVTHQRRLIASLVTTLGLAAMTISGSTATPVPSVGRLVQASDVTFVGTFRPPQAASLRYIGAGRGLTFDAATGTLFASNPSHRIVEFDIPTPDPGTGSNWPRASLLQSLNFASYVTAANQDAIGGLLVTGSELTIGTYTRYGNDGGRTHFTRSRDFSNPQVIGPVKIGPAGMVGGPMTHVPSSWRALVGGQAFTGLCCVSIISRSSYGPTLWAFDPRTLGNAFEVLGYPHCAPPTTASNNCDTSSRALGDWDSDNTLWNAAGGPAGYAWIQGTDSILAIGRHGRIHCYGEAAACGDPTSSSRGNHAYPYDFFVWAYDANDLVAVRNGFRKPWEVLPYATWTFDMPSATGGRTLTGVAYDPATQRVFLSEQGHSQQEIAIRVLKVNLPGVGFSDSDGDGIDDLIDQCPATPANTPVDAVGCPLAPPVNLVDVVEALKKALVGLSAASAAGMSLDAQWGEVLDAWLVLLSAGG